MKRRIKQNVWDNWYGYEGRYRTKEFGLDGAAAGHWLLTGDDTFNAAYASPETLRAAKIAAGLPVPAEADKQAPTIAAPCHPGLVPMTRDEVLRLAREAGLLPDNSHPAPQTRQLVAKEQAIERFAKLVAAHELNTCESICKIIAGFECTHYGEPIVSGACIAAIRTRGKRNAA